MATQSSLLAWRISWTEEPGGPQLTGWQSVNQTEHAHRRTVSLRRLRKWRRHTDRAASTARAG